MRSGETTSRSRPLDWVGRDAWLIMAARSLRGFAQASIALLIGIYLDLLGFSLAQIGLFISVGLAGSAFFSVAVVLIGDAWGRRRLLAGFTVLTGVTGLALALTDQYVLLALVAFIGSFNVVGGGPAGPVQPLERAALPEIVAPERRTDLFAVYSTVSIVARALGALAVGLPVLLQGAFGMGELPAYKVMFAGYALTSLAAGMLYLALSPAVEVQSERRRRWTNPFQLPSRRMIFTMAGLFAMDAFATRLVVQTLVALWFYTRFGFALEEVGFIFVGTNLMAAASVWIAAKLANRFGLVNTIVLTHVPAVVAVFFIPLMPTAGLAVGLWLVRAFFSQMDVPIKQSYTMAVVSSHERVAMAGVSNIAQSGIGAMSPSVAAYLWSSIWVGVPFFASGLLKAAYLVGFYLTFRNVHPPEEQARAEPTAAGPALQQERLD